MVTFKEKQEVISRLINVPNKDKRKFWSKEVKFLNILYEQYPDKKFWTSLSFSDILDSLLLLRSGYYAEELHKKYKLFHYKVPKPKKINLGKKTGETIIINKKPKTIKDFLS